MTVSQRIFKILDQRKMTQKEFSGNSSAIANDIS